MLSKIDSETKKKKKKIHELLLDSVRIGGIILQ